MSAHGDAGTAGGNPPSGGPSSGGRQGSNTNGPSQAQIAIMQAMGTPQALGSINQVPQPLLNALISVLQKKISSSSNQQASPAASSG